MEKSTRENLTYAAAGVDIDAGNQLVQRIKPFAERTRRPEVLAGLGGFGALFELPLGKYREPVLVSGTDGVGTKLKLAIDSGRHEGIGIDLVAMCVNDLIVQGAEPLFFLDYYATGRLDVETAAAVIEGIGQGCKLAGASLVGGETAEMPGMYSEGDYDLAGFCVGIVEKSELLDGRRVEPGDALIGLASSGPHSNGYSLIRRILAENRETGFTECGGFPLIDALLAPTRIYVQSILGLLRAIRVHAVAHITGGGITENLPRVLPVGCSAEIDLSAWPQPDVFNWIAEAGPVSRDEMLRTFNCGIGMIICVAERDVPAAMEVLSAAGERCWRIGRVITSDRPAQVFYQ